MMRVCIDGLSPYTSDVNDKFLSIFYGSTLFSFFFKQKFVFHHINIILKILLYSRNFIFLYKILFCNMKMKIKKKKNL